jgi:hypothetical protein
LSPQDSEDSALRQELQRISRDDPAKGAAARQALDALERPAPTEGRRQRGSRREQGNRRIVNGIQTIRHSAVAAVLRGSDPASAQAWCTGTLIACDKVLTAAHCIADDPSPGGYLAYFPSAGFYAVKDITWMKDDYRFPYADLALLTLKRSVEGIAPIALNTIASPRDGAVATIVGYGRTGGSRRDYGVKREGSARFGACQSPYAGKKLLCWDFDADINVTSGDANTCNADSGGGVFMLDEGNQHVVGVVSGGRDQDCVKGDHSYNSDVFQWRQWLASVGADTSSASTCGESRIDLPANLRSSLVTLGAEKRVVDFEFTVPPDTASLRVAMNGEDDGEGRNDFDLFLINGRADAAPACAQAGPGQFAFCNIERPEAGSWTISLRRKQGAGDAQLTVTLVPQSR